MQVNISWGPIGKEYNRGFATCWEFIAGFIAYGKNRMCMTQGIQFSAENRKPGPCLFVSL